MPIHPKHLIADDAAWLPPLSREDRILDAGCGHGALVRRLTAQGYVVVGVDRRVPDGPNFLSHDLEYGLPFPAGLFTLVLCMDVIEHLHHRREALAEFRRVLIPGGRLVITGPNRGSQWRRRLRRADLFAYADPDHKIEYTKAEFAAALTDAGFVIDTMQPIVYDTPLAGLMDCVGACSLRLYRRWMRYKERVAQRRPSESTGFLAICRRP